MKQAPKADHVAAGTRTIVFTPAKTFGLAETGEEIAAEIRLCKM
jgi:hypothetical protein